MSSIKIDMAYGTRVVTRRPGDFGASAAIVVDDPNRGHRMGVMVPVEGDRWIVTCAETSAAMSSGCGRRHQGSSPWAMRSAASTRSTGRACHRRPSRRMPPGRPEAVRPDIGVVGSALLPAGSQGRRGARRCGSGGSGSDTSPGAIRWWSRSRVRGSMWTGSPRHRSSKRAVSSSNSRTGRSSPPPKRAYTPPVSASDLSTTW